MVLEMLFRCLCYLTNAGLGKGVMRSRGFGSEQHSYMLI